jgi:hypothetical protein
MEKVSTAGATMLIAPALPRALPKMNGRAGFPRRGRQRRRVDPGDRACGRLSGVELFLARLGEEGRHGFTGAELAEGDGGRRPYERDAVGERLAQLVDGLRRADPPERPAGLGSHLGRGVAQAVDEGVRVGRVPEESHELDRHDLHLSLGMHEQRPQPWKRGRADGEKRLSRRRARDLLPDERVDEGWHGFLGAETAEAPGGRGAYVSAGIAESRAQGRDGALRAHVPEDGGSARAPPGAEARKRVDLAGDVSSLLEEGADAAAGLAVEAAGIASEEGCENAGVGFVELQADILAVDQTEREGAQAGLRGEPPAGLVHQAKTPECKHGDREDSCHGQPDGGPGEGFDHRRPRTACTRAPSSCGLKGFFT